jgi:penicillin-binding protein 1A
MIQERGYGATLALPIWVRIMERASRQKYPDAPFPAPEPLAEVQLCSISNELANDACSASGTSYKIVLPQSMVPHESCPVHRGQSLAQDPHKMQQNGEEGFGTRLFRSLRHLFGD